ncbi:hypothetical protein [Ferrovibrio sp.]|uniref:hypothetical protein n=1 Tax=Ferrovibrio sp. TaxID=1917215 RepID=UPI0035AF0197
MKTIVLDWDEAGRITRVSNAITQEDADALLAQGGVRPDAFSFESDQCWRDVSNWIVDSVNQTANYVEPSPMVPLSVTPLQARKALRAANLMSAVKSYIELQSEAVQEEWEFASEVRRDNATLLAAAAALDLTENQLDSLFVAAAEF